MDEAWLAAGVVEEVLEAAARLGVSPTVPIRRIRVLIGGLHGVDPYSFELGFRVASRGTPAADADLELQAMPVRVRCVVCGARRSAAWEGGWDIAACRVCWSLDVDVSGGDQLRVDVVELGDGRVAQG